MIVIIITLMVFVMPATMLMVRRTIGRIGGHTAGDDKQGEREKTMSQHVMQHFKSGARSRQEIAQFI